MKTEDTIVAPHLSAPTGTQEAMDATQTEAASKPAEKPRGPTMFVIVRADNGKPIVMANNEKWFSGRPLKAACGEWLKLKREVAVQLASGLEQKEEGLVTRIVPDFVFRREQREAKQATADEAAGLMKTLFGHGGTGVGDPNGPKHAEPMAAAFTTANGGQKVNPARFGDKSRPKKGARGGKRREDGDRRRRHREEAEDAE